MGRVVERIPGVLVAAVAVILFSYVGYAEAIRVYTEIRLERVQQLGSTIKLAVDQFAQTGLSLDQLGGFDRRVAQLRSVDGAIRTVLLTDAQDTPVTCAGIGDDCADPEVLLAAAHESHAGRSIESYLGDTGDYLVRLPIEDKFGVAGHLGILVDRALVEGEVDRAFGPVFIIAGLLFLGFVVVQLALIRPSRDLKGSRLLALFLVMTVVLTGTLVTTMFDLYRRGIEGQAEALARSMAARLSAVTELAISLDQLSEVESSFEEYRTINPNIAAIWLAADGVITYHSDAGSIGSMPELLAERIAFKLPVSTAGEKVLTLSVELPIRVVIEALAAGARNFAALFFACTLFCLLFLNAARQAPRLRADAGPDSDARTGTDAWLAVLLPAYFLGIMADGLTLSLLPEMSDELVRAAGLPDEWVSWPFSLFFIGLTAALLPSSALARRIDLRHLFLLGTLAVSAGLLAIGLLDSFWALCIGRAIGGIGQGVLLIAVQEYSFKVVSQQERTRAAAIQVLGYQGGLIVGTGIGGLIGAFNPDSFVVLIASGVGLAAMTYILWFLPSLRAGPGGERASVFESVGTLLRVVDFQAVLWLVGITSKFALVGVTMFAVPLLLSRSGYGDDEVGQALMMFAIATFMISWASPRLVRQVGSIDLVLVLGLLSLAAGIAIFSIATALNPADAPVGFLPSWVTDWVWSAYAWIEALPLPAALGFVIAISVIALGMGQGLITAPLVARVSETSAVDRLGRDRVLAGYRILERIGHIAGPALVGPLLLAASGNAVALIGLAGIYLLVAIVYAAGSALFWHARRPAA